MDDALTPFIKIPIPGPFITLNLFQLTALYIANIYFNYLLFCKTTLPYQKLKTPLRIYHIVLPFVFSPDFRGTITGFVAFPWLFASVGAYAAYKYKKLYSKESPMSFWVYLKAMAWEAVAHEVQPKNEVEKQQVAREGYTRLFSALAVTLVGKYVVTPLLLDDPRTLATMKWYSLTGIYYGFLMGLKGYMLMNINEILCCFPQILWGIRTLRCFNAPYLATSPKDFWGQRWNLIVRNLFHKQVFKKSSGSLAWNGFKAFLISASMHEIIMTF
ncbi:hypothetical protein K501DRAFT_332192, partial [Backusella circina FSU 941]